jgi:hypothetical protein
MQQADNQQARTQRCAGPENRCSPWSASSARMTSQPQACLHSLARQMKRSRSTSKAFQWMARSLKRSAQALLPCVACMALLVRDLSASTCVKRNYEASGAVFSGTLSHSRCSQRARLAWQQCSWHVARGQWRPARNDRLRFLDETGPATAFGWHADAEERALRTRQWPDRMLSSREKAPSLASVLRAQLRRGFAGGALHIANC